jgi:hypothetical protein
LRLGLASDPLVGSGGIVAGGIPLTHAELTSFATFRVMLRSVAAFAARSPP